MKRLLEENQWPILAARVYTTEMDIEVRLFALYKERAGCSEVVLNLEEGANVEDLTGEVRLLFPNLAPPDVGIVVAVNADYADPDMELHQGDEVCLIPPVSGGR